MGSGMAGRLLSAGFPLTVYNRNRGQGCALRQRGRDRRRLAARGRVRARTSSSAWSRMILPPAACGWAKTARWRERRRGAVLIECSTLTVGWIKELAAAAAQQGCELLDAPVTGTKPHAASGELSFLIGGSDAALATAQPVLSVLGREFIHLGPTGSGALMKLINNFMCGVQAASLAEAEYMIGAGGLDLRKGACHSYSRSSGQRPGAESRRPCLRQ